MWNKLKSREKRILILLGITAAVIFGYLLLEPVIQDYQQVKTERVQLRKTLEAFLVSQDAESQQQKNIASMVPVFTMPVKSEQQSILFRDEVTQQLQRAGIKAKSMQLRQNRAQNAGGYKVWIVECQGECRYDSMMRLVEQLKQNPYYVGIEKLVLKADSKDRNKLTFYLTVSTYAI